MHINVNVLLEINTKAVLENLRKNERANRDYILDLQMLIEYYNYIGIISSSKMMVYDWDNTTLVIKQTRENTYIELLNRQSALLLLYEELMNF